MVNCKYRYIFNIIFTVILITCIIITMFNRVKKIFIIVFIFILIVSLFTSCTGKKDIPLDRYFNYLRKLEYPRIYTMLSEKSKKKISLDDLCTRYENIYSAISVKSMTYDLITEDYTENSCHVFFLLSVTSDKLGDFMLNMSATFVRERNNWKLIWEPSLLLPGMMDEDEVRITSTPAERGEIFTSDGRLLAQNAIALTVYLNIDKIQNDETLIRVVSPILKIDESKMREILEPYYLKLQKSLEDTNDDTAEEYTTQSNIIKLKAFPKDKGPTKSEIEQLLSIPGVGIDDKYMTKIRYYPNGTVMSHTIGYVGKMSPNEAVLSENLTLPSDSMIGKSGLEKKYEMQLRARPSYKMCIIDKHGHEKKEVVYNKGQDGADLRLNIDLDLQIKAELLLMQNLTAEMAGSVIVLDPNTGAVKTMASFPSFDPNLFAFSLTQEEWAYLNDPVNRNPLYNRCIQGQYPPGSTFKPFTAAIAIETDSVSTNYVFKKKIKDNVWTPNDPEWVYQGITRFDRTPGDLNLGNALTYSDNIFFAYEALQIGRKTFYEFCQRFGMDEAIPFDLGVASAEIANGDSISDIKLLADSGYGQGELLTTPLQMASLFSSFANNGDIMQPRLISSINIVENHQYKVSEQFDPTVWKEDVIDSYSQSVISPFLRKVVTHGTGKGAYLSGVNIYGKTGTAEIGNDETREIAWFIGYTKDTNPKLVCITLEVPAEQGRVKLDIAKELFREDD